MALIVEVSGADKSRGRPELPAAAVLLLLLLVISVHSPHADASGSSWIQELDVLVHMTNPGLHTCTAVLPLLCRVPA